MQQQSSSPLPRARPCLLLLRGTTGTGESSVAERLHEIDSAVSIIEVDDLKAAAARRRATRRSYFLEAGRMAAEDLAGGRPVVVVEALCAHRHLEWVLEPTGLKVGSPQIRVVWLSCNLATAMTRKAGTVAAAAVVRQQLRCLTRFRVPGEHLVDTRALTVDEVTRQIVTLTHFPPLPT